MGSRGKRRRRKGREKRREKVEEGGGKKKKTKGKRSTSNGHDYDSKSGDNNVQSSLVCLVVIRKKCFGFVEKYGK